MTEESIQDEIGFAAGDIFDHLETVEEFPVKASDLRKELNLPSYKVYLALGWLAREEKVEVHREGKSVRVTI